jgi:lysophospholipase L1-like esterase/pimeloyl-ACP methyl ester carboxylesterase
LEHEAAARQRWFVPVMIRFLRSALVLFCAHAGLAQAALPEAKRIVFLGDSITQGGAYIELVEAALVAAHPDHDKVIIPLGLSSETVSGLSEDGHADGKFPRPDLHERLDRALSKTKPELVLACYGMNDGIYHPLSPERQRAFEQGMQRLHDKTVAAGAQIIHLTPPVFDPLPIAHRVLPAGLEAYPKPFVGYNSVLDAYSNWLLAQRGAQGWQVLDIHGPFNAALAKARQTDPKFTFSKDGIHPGPEGHLLMATPLLQAWGLKTQTDGSPLHPKGKAILELMRKKHALLRPAWLAHVGHKRPGAPKALPLEEALKQAAALDEQLRALARQKTAAAPAAKPGQWHGFALRVEKLAGHDLKIAQPAKAAAGKPWVWHGEFFGHKPAPDIALLTQGFHIVYLQIPNRLGSPEAVALWNQAYDFLTRQIGLGPKPALVGLSRGGLYCYNWAIANPQRVSCIYGDAPVCDFKSWPGGKGKGKGDPGNWKLVLSLWGFANEAQALAYRGNPVDSLQPLAKAGVPLLHVYGDADDVVPWEENTGLIAQRYRALGGDITLIAKAGVGHHPHGLEDSSPIVEFIAKHAAKP